MSRPVLRRHTAERPRSLGLISNPIAGAGKAGRRAERAAALLEDLGFSVESRSTARPGHARTLAREFAATRDAVAVLGGDGTVNEVVNGLAGAVVPLAILPGGTVNVLALELGLPFDLTRACALVTSGTRATLDLGRLEDRWFTLHAGVGLDALTVRTIDPTAKRRFGKLAFVAAGVRAFLDHPQPEFRVVVDGVGYEATFAVVANCAYYAGRFGAAVDADPPGWTVRRRPLRGIRLREHRRVLAGDAPRSPRAPPGDHDRPRAGGRLRAPRPGGRRLDPDRRRGGRPAPGHGDRRTGRSRGLRASGAGPTGRRSQLGPLDLLQRHRHRQAVDVDFLPVAGRGRGLGGMPDRIRPPGKGDHDQLVGQRLPLHQITVLLQHQADLRRSFHAQVDPILDVQTGRLARVLDAVDEFPCQPLTHQLRGELGDEGDHQLSFPLHGQPLLLLRGDQQVLGRQLVIVTVDGHAHPSAGGQQTSDLLSGQ